MTTETFFRKCAICGWHTTLVNRWFRYDNGNQELMPVCPNCAELHSSLTKAVK